MSAPDKAPAFSLFKARGQPGIWYGYVRIDGVTYKIFNARREGHGQAKHFVGEVKRHLKADQGDLLKAIGDTLVKCGVPESVARRPPLVPIAARQMLDKGFDDDELPEDL